MARRTASFLSSSTLSSSTLSPPWHSLRPSAKSKAERYWDTPVKSPGLLRQLMDGLLRQAPDDGVSEQPPGRREHEPPRCERGGIGQPVGHGAGCAAPSGRPE